MKNPLTIRPIQPTDCQLIHEAFLEQDWNKPVSQYEQYVQYQASGDRDILIAEWEGEIAELFRLRFRILETCLLGWDIPERSMILLSLTKVWISRK